MAKLEVFKLTRVPESTYVEDDDLIAISDAARLRDVSVQAIANAMSMGDLPEYFMVNPFGLPKTVRAQRFTSRKAVEALPKARGGRLAGVLTSEIKRKSGERL